VSDVKSRDRIVRAARRLFYTRGFESTSLGDLAREAGVPKGNFYYHFPSKDDVLRAVVEERRADIQRALGSWAQEYPDPRARLKRFVAMIASEREDLVSYGCPTGSLLIELGKKRHDLQPDALSILDLYVELAEGAFRELGHSDDEARVLAVHLLGRAQGAILVAHAYGDTAILDREIASIERWLDELT